MSKYSIAKFFRENVTLPKDTIHLYTDGQAAWDYKVLTDEIAGLEEQQEKRYKLIAASEQGSSGGGIADVSPSVKHADEVEKLQTEIEALQEERNSVLEKLYDSGVAVELRAMYPKEIRMADEKTRRELNAKYKDKPTPSEEEKTQEEIVLTNANYLSTSVVKMTFPDGEVVEAPIKPAEFRTMEEHLDIGEFTKMIRTLRELNMAQAMRDAQADAGFPGGLSESDGEQ